MAFYRRLCRHYFLLSRCEPGPFGSAFLRRVDKVALSVDIGKTEVPAGDAALRQGLSQFRRAYGLSAIPRAVRSQAETVNNFSDSLVHLDETLDDLRPAGMRIIQKADGYRFSLDPVLLCAFARIEKGDAVADLGTGSGVIPLLLAARTSAGRMIGVEIQPELADRARRSVLLNRLEKKVEILERDLRLLRKSLAPQSFDVVLSNPPYRRAGTGRKAPSAERAAARHELSGGLEDFLKAAAFLLRQGGRFYIVYLPDRLAELLSMMRGERLEPKRLRCVHSRAGEGARMVLVEGRKGGVEGVTVEPPLFIYDGERYTEEVLAIYGEGGSDK